MTRLDNRLKKTRVKQPPHLIVGARAGTGKTTTNIEGIKYLKGLPVSITDLSSGPLISNAEVSQTGSAEGSSTLQKAW